MTATSGILAALGGPFVMTLGFIIWDKVWKGSAFALNMFKCCLASLGFVVLSIVTRVTMDQHNDVGSNRPFPASIFTFEKVGYLMLSSTIGIIIGDLTWLESLRLIGARRVILVDTLKPFLAALFGWTILGETLPYQAFGGMTLTVIGVTWVSLEKEKENDEVVNDENSTNGDDNDDDVERDVDLVAVDTNHDKKDHAITVLDQATPNTNTMYDDTIGDSLEEPIEMIRENQIMEANDQDDSDKRRTSKTVNISEAKSKQQERSNNYRRGYALSILNVVLDTYGSLLTKEYGVDMTTWEINLIRFGFAGIVMVLISIGMSLWNGNTCITSMAKKKKNIVEPKDNKNKNYHEVVQTISTNTQVNDNDNSNETSQDTVEQQDYNSNDADDDSDDNNNSTKVDSLLSSQGNNDNDKVCWYLLPPTTWTTTINGDMMTRRSWIQIALGVLFVTFLTPALSNYALFQIALALALTLSSIGPLYALPLTWILQNDIPTWRSCIGALCAVAGIVILSIYR